MCACVCAADCSPACLGSGVCRFGVGDSDGDEDGGGGQAATTEDQPQAHCDCDGVACNRTLVAAPSVGEGEVKGSIDDSSLWDLFGWYVCLMSMCWSAVCCDVMLSSFGLLPSLAVLS